MGAGREGEGGANISSIYQLVPITDHRRPGLMGNWPGFVQYFARDRLDICIVIVLVTALQNVVSFVSNLDVMCVQRVCRCIGCVSVMLLQAMLSMCLYLTLPYS